MILRCFEIQPEKYFYKYFKHIYLTAVVVMICYLSNQGNGVFPS